MIDRLKTIDKYILTKGGFEIGIIDDDIQQYILTPSEYKEFSKWMLGQTCGVLGNLGGDYLSVTYTGDLRRFMQGLPCID